MIRLRRADLAAFATAVSIAFSGACGGEPDAHQPQGAPPAASGDSRPAALQASAAGVAHLIPSGTLFTRGAAPFEWRGISAFRLAELIAHGRDPEAIAFLDWAAARKLTVVRVFLMARNLFQLTPEDGLRAAPRLLELAAARGLHVELVALVDTRDAGVDLEGHVKAVGAVAAAHANAVVEIANEPWHPTQDTRLHDPVFVRKLAALVPAAVPVALGSAEGDPRYAEGSYATWHSPRGSGQDGWQHVLQLAAGAQLLSDWRKPLISDEPIGAKGDLIPGRRDNVPARFAAAGALTRLAGLGATFHYEGGLQAVIPSGAELESFTAWAAGLDLLDGLPPGGRFLDSAAVSGMAAAKGVRAVFARQYDQELWIVGIDPVAEASVVFGDGWTLDSTRSTAGVRLFRGRR